MNTPVADSSDPLDSPAWTPAGRLPLRPWREQLAHGYRGIKLGIRGHSRFSVHFFFAALALAAAIVLQCQPLEWCLLVAGIGLVLTAELFHSALEQLFHHLEPAVRGRARPCLDIAAGAVLLATGTAMAVGLLIFLPKLVALLLG